MRAACAFSVLLIAGCRVHTLEDGRYRFTVTEVLLDECGAGFDRTLGPGVMRTSGNLVELSLDRPAAQLAGTYTERAFIDLSGAPAGPERLILDGSSAMVPVTVGGVACTAQAVDLHMEAVTESPTRFVVTGTVTVLTPADPTCACRWWYRAAAELE